MGNTCYLNTALQCIFHTPELNRYIESGGFKKALQKEKKQSYVFLAYKKIFEQAGRGERINDKDLRNFVQISFLVSKMLNLSNVFSVGDQHDMVEFLQFVLDSFHECLSLRVNMSIEGRVTTRFDSLMKKSFEEWMSHYRDHFSIVIDTFSGQFYSKLVTVDTLAPTEGTERFDPFMILALPVPVPSSSRCSIHDCFAAMTSSELVEGWRGEKYGVSRVIKKSVCMWKTPPILIIQLKRFSSVAAKNNAFVEIPFVLDISPFTVEKEGARYELYAVANHVGRMGFGHYFAYCVHDDGSWYKYDDSHVTHVNSAEVNSAYNYCLFFRKLRSEE
jgi:ubiquitin carboxyl-terminal hydrolase 8